MQRIIQAVLATGAFASVATTPALAFDIDRIRENLRKMPPQKERPAPSPGPATSAQSPQKAALDALRPLPGIRRADWRRDTLFVFTDFRATEEQFDLLILQLCQSVKKFGVRDFYIHILDYDYAALGKTKTREHMLCR